ncbi:hypothetical protein EJ05DRAFT_185077 [Pseudovirgaria hyperparasitica]|uniref:Uncharacterized protein n=1 Tax=Pseudovirgaria hyperparasitica TaxID=470096 RepID=A0A6A6WI85_9PEZI|nr:uncharacterized protein EJ05DRAFT_185077 [Pseudovirgaria hyperparasitica]KAF2761784.1 hypothetical protein EJ05DRAFT_185077 [Pseudovirgaria hyperparasitica]
MLTCQLLLFYEKTSKARHQTNRKVGYLRVLGEIQSFYTTIRSSKDDLAMVTSHWTTYTELYRIGSPPPLPSPNQRSPVSISSMEVLERIIQIKCGDFDIDDPWATGEELGTGFGVFLGVWNGELSLSATYNDAFHEEGKVRGFLRRCQSILDVV